MPNFYTLTKKEAKEPTALQKIDEELCALFNAPVHPKYYIYAWENTIGWMIAVNGYDWDQMRERLERVATESKEPLTDSDLEWYAAILRIIDHFEKHYTTNAWAQIGNRR